MFGAQEVRFSLTLMINKEETKVLFASVDNTFADVLLSFLALPLGRILRLLQTRYGNEAPTIGSLKTMNTGLRNLDSVYFWTEAGKQILLNPRSSLLEEEYRKLKLNICSTQQTNYFSCDCSGSTLMVGLYHRGAICSNCGKIMNTFVDVKNSSCSYTVKDGGEVFTKNTLSFLITDDLRMLPNVTVGSFVQNLESLGITDDIRGAHLRTMTVGHNQIMDLLKGLLFSRAPLTDLFLHNGQIVHQYYAAKTNSEFMSLRPKLTNEENCSSSKKMKITAMVQKSSNKFLFVQAANDFIDFLFSLLNIPLGQVERLLDANSGAGSIDNLYRNVANLNAEKCLTTLDTKDVLLNPKLPHGYLSTNQIFSLEEQAKPKLYCHRNRKYDTIYYWSLSTAVSSVDYESHEVSFADPKVLGSYVKGNRMYMVTDDLTVTPMFTHSSLSTLMGLEVPITDIKELDINIGLEEALSILKAALTSTCATNGLNLNSIALKKQPKQEL